MARSTFPHHRQPSPLVPSLSLQANSMHVAAPWSSRNRGKCGDVPSWEPSNQIVGRSGRSLYTWQVPFCMIKNSSPMSASRTTTSPSSNSLVTITCHRNTSSAAGAESSQNRASSKSLSKIFWAQQVQDHRQWLQLVHTSAILNLSKGARLLSNSTCPNTAHHAQQKPNIASMKVFQYSLHYTWDATGKWMKYLHVLMLIRAKCFLYILCPSQHYF